MTEARQPPQTENDKRQQLEDISNRIVNPGSHQSKDHKVVFNAERPVHTRSKEDAPSTTVNLSKRHSKAPKTFLEKQLLQLGPRKRRKNLQDDIGGDFVPFEEQ